MMDVARLHHVGYQLELNNYVVRLLLLVSSAHALEI